MRSESADGEFWRQAMGGEKKAMEDKEEDMVEMWENKRDMMCREVEEEVELLELKVEAC